MKHVLTLLLSLLIANIIAQSSLGIIKGIVKDQNTKEPIIGAQVYIMINSYKVGGVTDIDGNFTINAVPTGTYDLVATYIGYDSITLKGMLVYADQFNFAPNVFLSKSDGVIMKGYTVKAYRPVIEKGSSGTRINLSVEEIKRSPVKFDINALAITSGAVSSTGDGQEIYFRGSRSGDVIYMIDGVKIMGQKPVLPSAAIQSMSVYTGGLPAKFGDTMGGVIAVETRSYFDLYYESLRNQ